MEHLGDIFSSATFSARRAGAFVSEHIGELLDSYEIDLHVITPRSASVRDPLR